MKPAAPPVPAASDEESDAPGGTEGRRPKRLFDGRRWLIVLLRALHLVAVVALGVFLHTPSTGSASLAGLAVLFTGTLMFVLDLVAYPWHLREVAGLSVIAKLLMVVAIAVGPPDGQLPLFWGVITWSAVFSHAPAAFRHHLLFPPPA